MTSNAITVDEETRTLTIERAYGVSAERVWHAWTEPALVARWWGPHGWTTTVHEMDVRPGGRWRYTMAPDDGSRAPMNGVATYSDVEPPNRLGFVDNFADDAWNVLDTDSGLPNEVTLEATGEGTRVRIVVTFADDDGLRRGLASGMSEGFAQALDRLDGVVRPGAQLGSS